MTRLPSDHLILSWPVLPQHCSHDPSQLRTEAGTTFKFTTRAPIYYDKTRDSEERVRRLVLGVTPTNCLPNDIMGQSEDDI